MGYRGIEPLIFVLRRIALPAVLIPVHMVIAFMPD